MAVYQLTKTVLMSSRPTSILTAPLPRVLHCPLSRFILIPCASLVSRDCEGEDLSQSTPRHIKVFKIAKEVNAADSLACFSATNILRDHVRLVHCELVDNQDHVFVGVSIHLQHQQGQL